MSGIATAIVGSTIVTSYLSSQAQQDAAQTAADASTKATDTSTAEIRRQFDAVQSLMKPYVDKGYVSLDSQADLLGMNGQDKQRAAIQSIQDSPEMAALTQQGEAGILANASATGGLRGGDVQSALGQFRPALLSQLIGERFNKLGQITQYGQASAAGTASAATTAGGQISGAIMNNGGVQANAALASGAAQAGMYNSIGNSLGTLGTLKLLKGF